MNIINTIINIARNGASKIKVLFDKIVTLLEPLFNAVMTLFDFLIELIVNGFAYIIDLINNILNWFGR